MTTQQDDNLRADYLEWTGGFSPASAAEIEMYLTFAVDASLPEGEVRASLRRWAENDLLIEVRGNLDEH